MNINPRPRKTTNTLRVFEVIDKEEGVTARVLLIIERDIVKGKMRLFSERLVCEGCHTSWSCRHSEAVKHHIISSLTVIEKLEETRALDNEETRALDNEPKT